MRFLQSFIQVVTIVLVLLTATKAQETLQEQISNIFNDVLEIQLEGSPGLHGGHFRPAKVAASATMINALNNFIGTSVSSFPLSSTAAGLTFDFSSGRPVSTSTSFGPIFAERAQTIGSGLINMGFNFTHIKYNKMRGVNTDDVRMSFTHQNVVNGTGLGVPDFELDYIDFYLHMDISASIFAFYLSYGITDQIDASVAVPFVNVAITAKPFARINSYTYISTGLAAHQFGSDSTQPILQKNIDGINDDATGIGDVAFRLKYNFLKSTTVDLATVFEYRMPSGDDQNFLGAGDDRYKLTFIASKIIGDFAPHLNLSYEYRSGKNHRDYLGVYLGYDQKITEELTLAVDFLGDFEMGNPIKEFTFPKPVTAIRSDSLYSETITPTNLPNYTRDNIINGAFGFKFNPKKSLMIIGNVFFPLNDGGLRSQFIPTLGVEFNF